VKVLWWLTHQEAEDLGFHELPAPVDLDSFSNLLKCRIKEVFDDCSSLLVINIFDIHDLAFMFHATTLEKHFVNCAGMTHVFFTRYCLLGSQRVVLVDYHIHSDVCIEVLL